MISKVRSFSWRSRTALVVALFAMAVLPWALVSALSAQNAPASQQQPQKPEDQPVPEAGGPGGDSGPVAVPRKKTTPDEAPAPVEPKVKNPPGMGTYSLHVDVPVVTVDVGVILQKTHQFVPGLQQQNF